MNAFTALGVTACTLIIIWVLAPRWPAGAWILGTVLAILLVRQTRAIGEAGLGWAAFADALRAWWWAYMLCLVVLGVLVDWRFLSRPTLLRGAAYLGECLVQQLIYQHLVCTPIRLDLGPNQKSDWAAASLFALVHLPNPVLVPATFVWGATAAHLYRRRPSLWAVAVLQYLLSGILYGLVPYAWFHGFRIGPSYFQR
ncbi:MAG TPA: CPBP family glutamic-type intramembrane protease [Bryobacteraceae bacterium]|jgi:hypothetical protein